MIASKFLSIMIGFLVHIFNHRTQSQTSWGCGGSAGPTRNVVTRSACEAAYKSIHYVTIGGGILAGEKTIMANSGNCRIVVSSTGAGASMQPDVDAAFREIFDSCPQDKWNGGFNSKPNFNIEVFSVLPDNVPFGSEIKLGAPTCKKGMFFTKTGFAKPEDCIRATSNLKPPEKGMAGLIGGASILYPALLVGAYKTCFVAVNSIPGFTVKLDIPKFTSMVNSITGTCKQDKGVFLSIGGSFGLNSRLFIETGFNGA